MRGSHFVRENNEPGFARDGVAVDLPITPWTVQNGIAANESEVSATTFVDVQGDYTGFEVRRASGTDADYAASITGTAEEVDSTVNVLVRGRNVWGLALVLAAVVEFEVGDIESSMWSKSEIDGLRCQPGDTIPVASNEAAIGAQYGPTPETGVGWSCGATAGFWGVFDGAEVGQAPGTKWGYKIVPLGESGPTQLFGADLQLARDAITESDLYAAAHP